MLLLIAFPFLFMTIVLASAQVSLMSKGRGGFLGWILVSLAVVPGVLAVWSAFRGGHADDAIRAALRVARARGGRVTALDLATDTSLSVEDAESLLRSLEDKGLCQAEPLGERKVYAFPGFGGGPRGA